MSIFSDYECGTMTDVEYRNACARMNREGRDEDERVWESDREDDDDDDE